MERILLERENDVAHDLWRQIFERAVAEPSAALHDPDLFNEKESKEVISKALKSAGWSETAIAARVGAFARHEPLDYATSPGVGFGLEGHLREIAGRIQTQMSDMGIASHTRVALGIDPKAGVSASLTNVTMTDEGIVSVSSFLFRWCGLIARAFVRTLHLDVKYWSESSANPEKDKEVLLRRPDLIVYWAKIFASYATTGTHAFVPFLPCAPAEVILFEQIAWAIEFYVVAHEYGHHAHNHRASDANPKTQEFEADDFAVKVCERLGFEPFSFAPNPYATTGAAATLMLYSLTILRDFEGADGTSIASSDTHPAAAERAKRIGYRHVLQPDVFAMDQNFNNTVSRIMEVVRRLMTEFLEQDGMALIDTIRLDLAR